MKESRTIIELSDAELDHVAGAANTNVFADSSGFPTGKVTGSFNLFTLEGPNAGLINGDHGAANVIDHFAIK
jgi:hypothetical protein